MNRWFSWRVLAWWFRSASQLIHVDILGDAAQEVSKCLGLVNKDKYVIRKIPLIFLHNEYVSVVIFSDAVSTQGNISGAQYVPDRCLFNHQLTSFVWLDVARPFRAKLRSNRSFATVSDPPVRRYGGLKDQDRIFTNVYSRHDHGIKGAQVHFQALPTMLISDIFVSPEVIGTKPKRSCSRVILGLSRLSRIPDCVVVAVPGFPVVWNGVSWTNRIGSKIFG